MNHIQTRGIDPWILEDPPVSIDTPFQARRLQRSDPLPRQRQVGRFAQVPGVAPADGGAGGLDVKPKAFHDDLVVQDHLQEFVDLGLDGFAGATGLSAGT